jgi:hypothetical protein
VMGVASPYWMKSINPAVDATLPSQSAAAKAPNQNRETLGAPKAGLRRTPDQATPPSNPETAMLPNRTAGGQK